MEELKAELERLKSDPPSMNEPPAAVGQKLIRLFDCLVRIGEHLTRQSA